MAATPAELEELRLVIEELHAGLDSYPYDVYLGVPPGLGGDGLRRAFHARAARFHPDQFYALGDDELKRKVYAVYKRITEAYRVLSDPEARRRWDEERARGAHRLENTGRFKVWRPEEGLSVPGRKYFGLAVEAARHGDTRGVRLNLQLALQFDPESAFLREKLAGLEPPK